MAAPLQAIFQHQPDDLERTPIYDCALYIKLCSTVWAVQYVCSKCVCFKQAKGYIKTKYSVLMQSTLSNHLSFVNFHLLIFSFVFSFHFLCIQISGASICIHSRFLWFCSPPAHSQVPLSLLAHWKGNCRLYSSPALSYNDRMDVVTKVWPVSQSTMEMLGCASQESSRVGRLRI